MQAQKLPIKYKLLQCAFWLLVAGWHYHDLSAYNYKGAMLPKLSCVIASAMFASYSILYIVVPRFLFKRKMHWFVISALAVLFASGIFNHITHSIFVFKSDHPFRFQVVSTIASMVDSAVATSIFLGVVLTYRTLDERKKQHELDKQLLVQEIQSLRQQMNPHFLFNALNSIYVTMGTSPELARTYLMQFSELLRHQLYESQNSTVGIESEVEFVKKYVALESIRKDSSLDINTNYDIQDHQMLVPPMILQPLVENAFKYVSHQKPASISINISCANSQLMCNICNTYDAPLTSKGNALGHKNIRRRLDVLFPNKYKFDIATTADQYCVKLQINA
ncbi:MAG: hypothetical protein RL660_868 [Bacteroidota bacterium]|jgi:LytS/YehU family sensor histidine kinase